MAALRASGGTRRLRHLLRYTRRRGQSLLVGIESALRPFRCEEQRSRSSSIRSCDRFPGRFDIRAAERVLNFETAAESIFTAVERVGSVPAWRRASRRFVLRTERYPAPPSAQ